MSLSFYGHTATMTDTACWNDLPDTVKAVTRGKGTKVPKCTDGRKRPNSWVSGLVFHTTSGTARTVKKGLIESFRDWAYAKYQTNTPREVSWHATVDSDGSIIQQAGPEFMCWHASQVNPYADGWEFVESAGGVLTEVQIARGVELADNWTWHAGIPRITPTQGSKPFSGMLSRALGAHGAGISLACVYGHRNVWYFSDKTKKLEPYRGKGDPGDFPFEALLAAGYLGMDVEHGEDLVKFKAMQTKFGLNPDGVWGRASRKAAYDALGPDYLFVRRPGDEQRGRPAFLR